MPSSAKDESKEDIKSLFRFNAIIFMCLHQKYQVNIVSYYSDSTNYMS